MAAVPAKIASVTAGVTGSRCSRTAPRRSSIWWVASPRGAQPTVYAAPLSVCAARKTVASVSSSRAPPSMASRAVVMASRCSAASGTKYSRTSPPSAKNRRRSAVSGEPGAGAGAGAVMKGSGSARRTARPPDGAR